jgi:XTP/dITP diphosphohydrolase
VKLLVATRSGGKQREIRRLLAHAPLEILFPDDAGVLASPIEDTLELGESFEANARAKAEYFARQTGLPAVADDSGLEVFSLGGEPGVRSRRWAAARGPEAVIDAANNAMLLQRLLGAPPAKRRARYRCVLVLYRTPRGFPESFQGNCPGIILEEPRGTGGFGYDPLFYSEALGKTFAEATPEEKDAVSHRGLAFRDLLQALGMPHAPAAEPPRPPSAEP